MEVKSKTISWALNHTEEGIIEINASGMLDSNATREQTEKAFNYAKRLNSFLFLLDYRDVRGNRPLLRIFELPELYHAMGVPRSSKIAVVLPDTKSNIEDYEFYETVCYNHGYDVELFEEKKHALDWLRMQRR
jgi:hypothetical protein